MFRHRLIATILLALGLYFIFTLSKSTYNLWKKASIVEETRDKRIEAEKRNKELREQLKFTQNPEFIEQQARGKLGLVKPGETVVVIPQAEASQTTMAENLPNWKRWWKLFF